LIVFVLSDYKSFNQVTAFQELFFIIGYIIYDYPQGYIIYDYPHRNVVTGSAKKLSAPSFTYIWH